ncbi:MAG TPA: amino acid ABC transporter permease [Microbacteriaceae bacterium]|nr:amino acid ABC transporter permease [Microbacteriaceae bacterium]
MLFDGFDWAYFFAGLPKALGMTLAFTAAAFVCAIVVGVLVAIMRTARVLPMRWFATGYTELFKNLPLITAIYIIYFGLPSLGIKLDVFIAGTVALVFFYGAYLGEIFRGGFLSVDKGQREAALAMGMRPSRVVTKIILPQAVRVALPGAGTMMVDLLKGTSLLVTIGGAELMTHAATVVSITYRPLESYTLIGLVYFALCFPLSRLVSGLEQRIASGVPLSPVRADLLRRARELVAARVAILEPQRVAR